MFCFIQTKILTSVKLILNLSSLKYNCSIIAMITTRTRWEARIGKTPEIYGTASELTDHGPRMVVESVGQTVVTVPYVPQGFHNRLHVKKKKKKKKKKIHFGTIGPNTVRMGLLKQRWGRASWYDAPEVFFDFY